MVRCPPESRQLPEPQGKRVGVEVGIGKKLMTYTVRIDDQLNDIFRVSV